MSKIKTYVIILSRTFPKSHRKAGKPTKFLQSISLGSKIHTIRANYDLWAKRFKEIEKGNAILSLRYWEGKPYASKQLIYSNLTIEDGIGLQKLILSDASEAKRIQLAYNDGLYGVDFENWFSGYDATTPMAIIHFTKFRYNE